MTVKHHHRIRIRWGILIPRLTLMALWAVATPIAITATPWTTPQIVTTLATIVSVAAATGLVAPIALRRLDDASRTHDRDDRHREETH